MKIIIHPNEAPIIYDDLGKRIEGIYNFDYHYVTEGADSNPSGANAMSLYYWSDDDTNYPSMLHQGWDKYNSEGCTTKPQGILHSVPNNFNSWALSGHDNTSINEFNCRDNNHVR